MFHVKSKVEGKLKENNKVHTKLLNIEVTFSTAAKRSIVILLILAHPPCARHVDKQSLVCDIGY